MPALPHTTMASPSLRDLLAAAQDSHTALVGRFAIEDTAPPPPRSNPEVVRALSDILDEVLYNASLFEEQLLEASTSAAKKTSEPAERK